MMNCHFRIGWLLLAVVFLNTGRFASAADDPGAMLFDDGEIVALQYPGWFKPSFLDLADDLADALDGGKAGLMLYFGSEGCAYCKAFVEHTLTDPALQDDLRARFDAIGLDMFSDVEMTDFAGERLRVKDFALREGASVSPTLLFYGAGGEPLLRIRGYYPPARFRMVLDYLGGGHYRTETLRAFAARQTSEGIPRPAEPEDDALFGNGAQVLDRTDVPAQQPLLVLFEAADCMECRQFRSEVLSYPPVRQLLDRYDTARLDWSDSKTAIVTPAGEPSDPAAWAERLGIAQVPALAFFDESGQEVFRLESLVLRQRMERALLYVLEKAYLNGTTYQQFTRAKTIEKLRNEASNPAPGG